MTRRTKKPQAATASAWAELEKYEFSYAHTGSELKDYIYGRSRRLFAQGEAERDRLCNPEDLRRWQETLRKVFIENLGGIPKSDTPLNARVTGVVPGEGFAIEKVIFESRPRHYVTANLYVPAGRTAPGGAVLFLCGHHLAAKQTPEYQAVCQTLVRAGLVVLAMDPIGQGERLGYFEPSLGRASVPGGCDEHDHAGVQCRLIGDGIARYFLHDAMRGIDYLRSRPEVAPDRIGVTGNSGGGMQTSLMMLADPRIAAAAPGTFITSRDHYQRTGQPQDAEQIWAGFTGAGYDHEAILLAMTPKPVCVLAATSDFFPIEGTRHTVMRARGAWDLCDRGDALELVEDNAQHAYTPTLARAAARFFRRHLLGLEYEQSAVEPTIFPAKVLQCTVTGQVRGELPGAEFVFEANAVRCEQIETERRSLAAEELRARARAWLRERVFAGRLACAPQPRLIERGRRLGPLEVDIAFWWTQPDLANLGLLFRARDRRGAQPVTLAVWDGGTQTLSDHAKWIEATCAAGREVLVLSLCGVGPLRPDPINTWPSDGHLGTLPKLGDDLLWLGDSLVALRTFELLRVLDVLATWPDLAADDVTVYGSGRMGLHARLAAALDSRIKGCEWGNAFIYRDYARSRLCETAALKPFLLPGVLRYFDVDEL